MDGGLFRLRGRGAAAAPRGHAPAGHAGLRRHGPNAGTIHPARPAPAVGGGLLPAYLAHKHHPRQPPQPRHIHQRLAHVLRHALRTVDTAVPAARPPGRPLAQRHRAPAAHLPVRTGRMHNVAVRTLRRRRPRRRLDGHGLLRHRLRADNSDFVPLCRPRLRHRQLLGVAVAKTPVHLPDVPRVPQRDKDFVRLPGLLLRPAFSRRRPQHEQDGGGHPRRRRRLRPVVYAIYDSHRPGERRRDGHRQH